MSGSKEENKKSKAKKREMLNKNLYFKSKRMNYKAKHIFLFIFKAYNPWDSSDSLIERLNHLTIQTI